MKCIIKNCPALSEDIFGIGYLCHDRNFFGRCVDNEKCVIKRMIYDNNIFADYIKEYLKIEEAW